MSSIVVDYQLGHALGYEDIPYNKELNELNLINLNLLTYDYLWHWVGRPDADGRCGGYLSRVYNMDVYCLTPTAIFMGGIWIDYDRYRL